MKEMREIRIAIALSSSEKKEISTEAARSGITTGEFVRYATFRFIRERAKKNLSDTAVGVEK